PRRPLRTPADRTATPSAVRSICLDLLLAAGRESVSLSLEVQRPPHMHPPMGNPPVRSSAAIFIGRSRELAELRAAVDEAQLGRGRLFLLSGDPGIGKTRLAEEIDSYARRCGTEVLWGRCDETGGAPAYWPWIQLIRSYAVD